MALNLNAERNKSYSLECFLNLGDATTLLGTNLTGPEILDSNPNEPARYYRLREE